MPQKQTSKWGYLEEGGLAAAIGTEKHPKLPGRNPDRTILQNRHQLPLLVQQREVEITGFDGRCRRSLHRNQPRLPTSERSQKGLPKNHPRNWRGERRTSLLMPTAGLGRLKWRQRNRARGLEAAWAGRSQTQI